MSCRMQAGTEGRHGAVPGDPPAVRGRFCTKVGNSGQKKKKKMYVINTPADFFAAGALLFYPSTRHIELCANRL